MKEFSLAKYKKEHNETKVNKFINYLYETLGDGTDDFDNEYFTLLSIDDLVESLKRYISSSAKAQTTANNYVTYVSAFFDMLMRDYQIENPIFSNVKLKDEFLSRCKEIIVTLREVEPKDIMTEEQYENLNNGINNYIGKLGIGDIIDEVNRIYQGMQEGKELYTANYHIFVSIIPVKLIDRFALSNLAVISLETSCLDLENRYINLNGLILPLNEELMGLLNTYIEIRKYILNLYNIDEKKFFIKPNGSPYITVSKERKNKTEYGAFFKIMDKTINHRSAERLAKKRALDLIDNGLDLFVVLKLLGGSQDNFIKLLDENTNIDMINEKISNFFLSESNNYNNSVYSLTCPFCNNKHTATSNNWVIVQFSNRNEKFIVCKKCKGENKNKIL
ncbi:MAG TPA: hypothetical protein GXZ21_03845 [Clostridiales bacterium]|mgnify:CR=1 FL=1|nr:hypothetical protein [Clostridiales bacterium]